MKKFTENMIVCGTAFALLIALTASNAHAQNNMIYRTDYRVEPLKLNPVQVSTPWNAPQKNMPQQPQQLLPPQRLPVVPAAAVMPVTNPSKPALKPALVAMPNRQPDPHHMPMIPVIPAKHVSPIVMQPVVPANHITPANHIAVNPPHICPEPQKTVVVEQPKVIVVQQPPKKSLLEKLFDKIF
ncbi:MAG: hypothetical protein FWC50_09790 [Planctomycetaceae bacterium]|nr:hypothetical protein [Planctomycetaceae bacterium]